MDYPDEPRQHDLTRADNERMVATLRTFRRYFRAAAGKKFSEEQIEESNRQFDHLERVLEFSATWKGVLTGDFFPDATPEVQNYLITQNITRLGGLFKKPFAEVSNGLRAVGAEYPPLLKMMFEAFYADSLHRSAMKKELVLH